MPLPSFVNPPVPLSVPLCVIAPALCTERSVVTFVAPRLKPPSSRSDTVAPLIVLIVASANVFAWILARERIPQEITAAVIRMELSSVLLLLLLHLLLLLLGMILDTAGILILVTPVVVPAVVAVGIDPVHFGMVMIVNMMIGLVTPPVGMALFIVSNLSGAPIAAVARECAPFIAGFMVVLALITYVPELVLWLPNLVYGPPL